MTQQQGGAKRPSTPDLTALFMREIRRKQHILGVKTGGK